jgi:hypothetical protein
MSSCQANEVLVSSVMAELKTQKTKVPVNEFLGNLSEVYQKDCKVISKLMSEATGAKPKMWGPAIVGFGDSPYTYPDGRTMDWFTMGFSPRKQAITLYIKYGTSSELLKKLGKYKTGKWCLYIKKLEDVDLGVLKKMIVQAAKN